MNATKSDGHIITKFTTNQNIGSIIDMTDKEKIRAEIERRLALITDVKRRRHIAPFADGAIDTLTGILSFIDSLPDEPKCIFGNKPSEEGCRYCTASCELRVPKTESSSSVTFEEYLYGTFEINNGLDNDPALLATLHAPTLLELAKEKLRED